MQLSSEHRKGLLITFVGVLILSPDTLIVRLVDTDTWTLMFWRGLFLGLGLLVLYAVSEGPGWLAKLRALGRPGLLASALFSCNAIFFIVALAHTSVANTLLIVASAPLLAAVFSWAFLREQVPRRTWIAILIACSGIAVIFTGSLGPGALEGGSLLGDLAALVTAIGIAGGFVVIRRNRQVNMIPTLAIGGFISAAVSLPLAAPFSVPPDSFAWLLLMGLLLLPIAFGLIALGPRYLPAPEVSLMMLLETVLGPLLVWWALGESASLEAMIGGTIVVATLALHAAVGLHGSAEGVGA